MEVKDLDECDWICLLPKFSVLLSIDSHVFCILLFLIVLSTADVSSDRNLYSSLNTPSLIYSQCSTQTSLTHSMQSIHYPSYPVVSRALCLFNLHFPSYPIVNHSLSLKKVSEASNKYLHITKSPLCLCVCVIVPYIAWLKEKTFVAILQWQVTLTFPDYQDRHK